MGKKNTDEVKLTETQKKVIAALKRSKTSLGVADVAGKVGLPNASTWSSLRSLAAKGLAKSMADGTWKAA